MSKYPRYCLHLGTCVAIVLLAGALAWANGRQQRTFVGLKPWNAWPLKYEGVGFGPGVPRPPDRSGIPPIVNPLACIVLLLGAGAFLEAWFRSPNKLQFQLSTLLAATAVVALMVTFWSWETTPHPNDALRQIPIGIHLGAGVSYVPTPNLPWAVSIPIRLAAAATLFTILRLVGGRIAKLFQFLRPVRRTK